MALLAVNEVGHESGVESMAALGDLPILQDTSEVEAWSLWDAEYRDVVLLDEENKQVDVFNLTDHDLNDPNEYQALSELITELLTP